jgi:hypothetical protein
MIVCVSEDATASELIIILDCKWQIFRGKCTRGLTRDGTSRQIGQSKATNCLGGDSRDNVSTGSMSRIAKVSLF